ncbi:ATP-binding protein [Ramlibacter albus]|uniref:histidine kinase n=1 Tax=Ramlibacter albus TaxID=2079448 RepID=A0A923M5P9_9BURK|nr:ATP-binding protein [Ramlibacter albus]MBC5763299.1 response regulator [Ramlibacter albus]
MLATGTSQGGRILLIDDVRSIHEDFERILAPHPAVSELEELGSELFGEPAGKGGGSFELDSAYQGQEGLAKLQASLRDGRPYAVAFVDMRMPPGWDGLETIEHLWATDPQLQVVVCTAYSDYPWDEFVSRLDAGDNLLILKKPFDPAEVMQLARALAAKWAGARRAAALVQELTRQLEAARAGTPSREVDMGDVLRRTLGELALPIAGTRAVVDAGPMPRINGDPEALAHILRHLVANAIRFVPPDRTPAVRVECSEGPREWTFSVRDNGIGLAAERADRIFTVFPQVPPAGEQGGIGVGLAVCRKIVESCGGRIWVESSPGAGATFSFSIPRQA